MLFCAAAAVMVTAEAVVAVVGILDDNVSMMPEIPMMFVAESACYCIIKTLGW